MPKIILKIIPAIIFWGIFIGVVLQIPYPDSLTQANLIQVLAFFIPLYLSLTLTLNILFKNLPASFSISLGLIFLLTLKALDSLNLVTAILIILAVSLLLSYFKKTKNRDLTKLPKIPKLTKW